MRVCVELLMAVYGEYRLWYVSTVIIAFARKLVFAMEVPLMCRATIRNALELIDVIEDTNVYTVPEQ